MVYLFNTLTFDIALPGWICDALGAPPRDGKNPLVGLSELQRRRKTPVTDLPIVGLTPDGRHNMGQCILGITFLVYGNSARVCAAWCDPDSVTVWAVRFRCRVGLFLRDDHPELSRTLRPSAYHRSEELDPQLSLDAGVCPAVFTVNLPLKRLEPDISAPSKVQSTIFLPLAARQAIRLPIFGRAAPCHDSPIPNNNPSPLKPQPAKRHPAPPREPSLNDLATPPPERHTSKRSADTMLDDADDPLDSLQERRRSLEADPRFHEILPALVTLGLDALDEYNTRTASLQELATAPGTLNSTPPTNHPPRLACPLYLLNPASHAACLALAPELLTLPVLLQHLIIDHRRREYCPICWTTFPSGASRDRHIVCRSCTARQGTPPDGVTGEQADALLDLFERRRGGGKRRKRGNGAWGGDGEEGMWRRMWDVLFPELEWTGSVYLESEGEMELVAMRRFWDREGAGVMAGKVDEELLRSHGLVGEEAVVAVCGLVLKGMMEQSGLLPEALVSDGETEG